MSDEVLSAERIAYQATTHECGWAEHHINALVESKVAEALTQAQASLAAARERAQEVLKRWIVDANEGRIKFGTRELTNDELALIGDALRCVAADMKAAELKGEQRP